MNETCAKDILDKTRKDYDLIADDFSRTRQAPWDELRFSVDNYVKSGDRILDLGCGNGRLLEFLRGKEIKYLGVDNSARLIEIARRKYPEFSFQVADALNLPFPKNFFNKIYSIAVLHHIPSVELRLKFLSEARRVLSPGGVLIVTVWRFHELPDLMRILKYAGLKLIGGSQFDFGDLFEPWADKTKRYYHCFSQKEVKNLTARAGFKILEAKVVKNNRGNRQNIFLAAEKIPV